MLPLKWIVSKYQILPIAVFDLTRPGLEPKVYYTGGKHVYYSTNNADPLGFEVTPPPKLQIYIFAY